MASSQASAATAAGGRDARASTTPEQIPQTAIPLSDGLLGLAGLLAAWLLVMVLRPHALVSVWVILFSTAVPMLAVELERTSHPADRESGRMALLLWPAGFLLASLPFLLIHAQGMGIELWLIAWAVAVPAFMLRLTLEFRRNGGLSGGLPLALARALLPFDRGALRSLVPAVRLWALKGFFVPLYGLSLFALVGLAFATDLGSPLGWLSLGVVLAYTIDLSFGLSGYVFASNALAPTVRSTQPMLLGWIVCIACYGPVITHWPDFEAVVRQEIAWPQTFTATPVSIAAAGMMIGLLVLYVSASVCFGLRFSNLSNRGVITTGPYRWMKHPAYFAHAANAWLLCVILMPAAGIHLGIAQWLVPIAFTVLYRLRAVTEEQHMSEEPAYREYAAWIARNGILGRLRRFAGLQVQASRPVD